MSGRGLRLTAEQVAARYTAMERIHIVKVLDAIEEIRKEKADDGTSPR